MAENDGKIGGLFNVDQCNQSCPDGGLGDRKSSSLTVFSNLTIEMIELDQSSKAYTSLKKLLRTPSMPSPVGCNSSWHDIPLKDPLVKQAAWAYLQPMAASPGEDCQGGGLLGIFRRAMDDKPLASSPCGCLAWLNEVVVKGVLELLSGKKRTDCLTEEEKFDCRGDCGDDGKKAD